VFLVVDESEMNNKNYLNILCGDVEYPYVTKLLDTIQIEGSLNSLKLKQYMDETLAKYNIKLKNFYLMVSDAASYMLKTAGMYKESQEIFFHIACLAHLVHNCAM
jgi:hypothetical protein